jgi:hypothetical protein
LSGAALLSNAPEREPIHDHAISEWPPKHGVLPVVKRP